MYDHILTAIKVGRKMYASRPRSTMTMQQMILQQHFLYRLGPI